MQQRDENALGPCQGLLLHNPLGESMPAVPHHDFSQRRLPPPLGTLSSLRSVIPTCQISWWSAL